MLTEHNATQSSHRYKYNTLMEINRMKKNCLATATFCTTAYKDTPTHTQKKSSRYNEKLTRYSEKSTPINEKLPHDNTRLTRYNEKPTGNNELPAQYNKKSTHYKKTPTR